MAKLKVAAVQMKSGGDKEKNLKQAEKFINIAAKKKAVFVALPEVFNFRGKLSDAAKSAETIPGDSTKFISNLARKNKIWILIGSMIENPRESEEQKIRNQKKPFNTSVLIDPQGKIIAKYRKIHLFDIKLKGKSILESSRNKAGDKPRLTKIKNVKVGLSICYDLRFPELYRKYSEDGAEIICIPSSFTKPTGEAHWHTLIKSRAIENLCYVIAPNQAGTGSGGIKTFGHSLIVDPWGKILAEGPANDESVIFADINLDYLKKIRANLPALEHRRL